MTTAVRPQTLVAATSTVETQRAGWVARYRSEVPTADRWAQGITPRTHSLETQERVFRMAEQLARQSVPRLDLLASLEEADRSVATVVDPQSAANAGYRAIAPLVRLAGGPIVIGDNGQPDLRAFGFDPIPFDGHDPAAYAWAMFELTMQARADADRQFSQCACHRRWAPTSIGLARL